MSGSPRGRLIAKLQAHPRPIKARRPRLGGAPCIPAHESAAQVDLRSGEAQSSCCRALSVPSPAARSLAHCSSTERASVTSVRACTGDSGSMEVLDAVVYAGAIRELDVCALDLEVYVRRRRPKTPVKAARSLKQLPDDVAVP